MGEYDGRGFTSLSGPMRRRRPRNEFKIERRQESGPETEEFRLRLRFENEMELIVTPAPGSPEAEGVVAVQIVDAQAGFPRADDFFREMRREQVAAHGVRDFPEGRVVELIEQLERWRPFGF